MRSDYAQFIRIRVEQHYDPAHHPVMTIQNFEDARNCRLEPIGACEYLTRFQEGR